MQTKLISRRMTPRYAQRAAIRKFQLFSRSRTSWHRRGARGRCFSSSELIVSTDNPTAVDWIQCAWLDPISNGIKNHRPRERTRDYDVERQSQVYVSHHPAVGWRDA